jgi:hypothetical protein
MEQEKRATQGATWVRKREGKKLIMCLCRNGEKMNGKERESMCEKYKQILSWQNALKHCKNKLLVTICDPNGEPSISKLPFFCDILPACLIFVYIWLIWDKPGSLKKPVVHKISSVEGN